MMRGGTPFAYFLANYTAEVFSLLLMGLTVYLFMSLTHTPMGLYIVPIVLWALAEPLFLHFVKTLLYTRCKVSRNIFITTLVLTYLVGHTVNIDIYKSLRLGGERFNSAKRVSMVFCWMPTANFVNSTIYVILRQRIAMYQTIHDPDFEWDASKEIDELGPQGCRHLLKN